MGKGYIVMGDMTSHGGTIIATGVGLIISGKPVALDGDMAVCPVCKTSGTASASTSSLKVNGKAVLVDGDKMSCGAKLIATQVNCSSK